MEKKDITKIMRHYRKRTQTMIYQIRKGVWVRKSFQKGLRGQLPDIANSKVKFRRTECISLSRILLITSTVHKVRGESKFESGDVKSEQWGKRTVISIRGFYSEIQKQHQE